MKGERPAARLGRPPKASGERPTRDRIFEAAVDLFSSQGYDRTSMRQLAASVGLTESAVYRHFPSKDAVLAAILAYTEREVFSPLPEPEAGVEPASIFRRLLYAPLDAMLADPLIAKIMRIMYAEMLRDEGLGAYYRAKYVDRANDLLEGIFRDELASGRLRDCDAGALAQVFNAFRSEWAFQTFLLADGPQATVEGLGRGLEAPLRLFESLLVRSGEPSAPASAS